MDSIDKLLSKGIKMESTTTSPSTSKKRAREEGPPDDNNKSEAIKNGNKKAAPQAATAPVPVPANDPIAAALAKSAKDASSRARRRAKLAAAIAVGEPPKPLPVPDESVWNHTILTRIARCEAAEGIRATSYYKDKDQAGGSSTATSCLRRLLQEISSLQKDLPTFPAIWVRFDEEMPQFLRAIITAPTDTPYSLGLFCFDIYIPSSYPAVPPKMQLLTTGGGQVRFSPNLYANGKVCLSLLGTWSGPSWNSNHSTLLQCLVSLQGLILGVEHPYYLEPGYGGWEKNGSDGPVAEFGGGSFPPSITIQSNFSPPPGLAAQLLGNFGGSASAAMKAPKPSPGTSPGISDKKDSENSYQESSTTKMIPSCVQHYDEKLKLGTVRYAMLAMLQSIDAVKSGSSRGNTYKYLLPFVEIIQAHFYHCKDRIIAETEWWEQTLKLSSSSSHGMKRAVAQLKDALEKLEPLPSSASVAASSASAAASADSGLVDAKPSALQREIEEAAANRDWQKVCRLQTGLNHVNQHGSIEAIITNTRNEMETAATKKDYISAGKHQMKLLHLESNKHMLEHLENRMLDAASKLDFVRAGNFQQQYKILMSCDDSLANSKIAMDSTAGRGKNPYSKHLAKYHPGAGGISFSPFGPPPPEIDYDDYPAIEEASGAIVSNWAM